MVGINYLTSDIQKKIKNNHIYFGSYQSYNLNRNKVGSERIIFY